MAEKKEDLSYKSSQRQKLLWYSFWFIIIVTLLSFVSAWMDKDLAGIEAIIGTTIGALSLLGIGNMATNPGDG